MYERTSLRTHGSVPSEQQEIRSLSSNSRSTHQSDEPMALTLLYPLQFDPIYGTSVRVIATMSLSYLPVSKKNQVLCIQNFSIAKVVKGLYGSSMSIVVERRTFRSRRTTMERYFSVSLKKRMLSCNKRHTKHKLI